MFSFALFPFIIIFFLTSLNIDARIHGENDYGGNARRVNVNDDDMMQIYQKWVDTGLSSLMAAVADQKLKKHRSLVANKFGKCSNRADSVPKQARCLNDLLKNRMNVREAEELKRLKSAQRLQKYGQVGQAENSHKWTGAFRMSRRKREVPTTRTNYDLHSTQNHLTPLGGVAKLILESVLAKHNKTETTSWQSTIVRLKEAGDRKQKLRKKLEDSSNESMDQLAMRGLKAALPKNGEVEIDELHDPEKLQKFIKASRAKKNKKPEEKVMDLLRDGFKLGYTLAGQNTTNFDNKTLKLISPRFFGLVPEEKQKDELTLLSPSLFSLHREGEGIENMTSIFNLLKNLPLRDQQIWLDMIMEASGVNDHSAKMEKEIIEDEQKHEENEKQATKNATTTALQLFDPSKLKDEYGTPLYFEKHNASMIGGRIEERKIEVFEALHQSYNKEQLHQMNTTGYAFLTKEQLQHLYGPKSPYNSSGTLEKFMGMHEEKMNDYVERDIQTLSELEKFQLRQKDIVLSPISFTFLTLVPVLASQPLILSPVIFSPLILSPSVFGAVILSPWMFVPLVLSPRVLGALILSPFIFAPLILTPLVLHPAILSPGIFNPLILSPAVLTPIILSPQVFTPLILSPLVLSPIILAPLVGSPLILSPFVLSPIIASPQFLGGLILSPYVLSPVLLSPLIAFAAVLSPSFLS